MIPFALAVWKLHGLQAGIAIWGSFALGRFIAVLWLGLSNRKRDRFAREQISESADRVLNRIEIVGVAEALVFVSLGIGLLILLKLL
jgi:hypothetical protein